MKMSAPLLVNSYLVYGARSMVQGHGARVHGVWCRVQGVRCSSPPAGGEEVERLVEVEVEVAVEVAAHELVNPLLARGV